jgi:replicative superfamily II helicase
VSKKKHKFDLTNLVHQGHLKDGQTLFFVSDPKRTCRIAKQPNGEYKVVDGKETITVHAFAQKCLGQEPPDHASKWVRTEAGKTLFDFWHQDDMADAA